MLRWRHAVRALLLVLLCLCAGAPLAAEEEQAPTCAIHALLLTPEDGRLWQMYDGVRMGLEVARLPRICVVAADTEAEQEAFQAQLATELERPTPSMPRGPLAFAFGDEAGDLLVRLSPRVPRVFVTQRFSMEERPLATLPKPEGLHAVVYGDIEVEWLGRMLRDLLQVETPRVAGAWHKERDAAGPLVEMQMQQLARRAGITWTPLDDAERPPQALLHLRFGLGERLLPLAEARALSRRLGAPLVGDDPTTFGQGIHVTVVSVTQAAGTRRGGGRTPPRPRPDALAAAPSRGREPALGGPRRLGCAGLHLAAALPRPGAQAPPWSARAGRARAMNRSLVVLTLLLVGGVVIIVGSVVLLWIAADDHAREREDQRAQQAATEAALADLSELLLELYQGTARGLVQGTDRRLREWLEQEPLSLYREAKDPSQVDIVELGRRLAAQVREREFLEEERIEILTGRMRLQGEERIASAIATLRSEAGRRGEEATSARTRTLTLRMSFLLLGMALLLALTLGALVVRPVRRLRTDVQRIADGDLTTAVSAPKRGATELLALTRDVEAMRARLQVLTGSLEAEVERKTVDLERSLAERTQALEELEAAQAGLVQAAKMAGLGTLAGGIAHEFNNLLGGILGNIENARAGTQDEGAREDLDVAKRTAERAAVLIRALLDVARPGTRTLAPVPLADLVRDVLQTARPSAVRAQVELEAELPEAGPIVLGDEGQLHQVVLNLITNALQAAGEGGRVVVEIGEARGRGFAEVRDSGPGIPAADRDRIYEPFFTTREDGTGLGLFVSYGIVERHGGALEVGDADEGGARLRVSIPLA